MVCFTHYTCKITGWFIELKTSKHSHAWLKHSLIGQYFSDQRKALQTMYEMFTYPIDAVRIVNENSHTYARGCLWPCFVTLTSCRIYVIRWVLCILRISVFTRILHSGLKCSTGDRLEWLKFIIRCTAVDRWKHSILNQWKYPI